MDRASPEFLPSDAVMAKIAVLDAFCWIKNAQKSISAEASPRIPLGLLTPLPDLVGGQGDSCPSPQELYFRLGLSGLELRPLGLAAQCLLTFDYLSPPLGSTKNNSHF